MDEKIGAQSGDFETGIRKAAVFFSILDAKTAETLLTRFEPDVARAIVAEASRAERVAPEDVDAVISEFLTFIGSETLDSAPKTSPMKERRTDETSTKERSLDEKSNADVAISTRIRADFEDFCALDSFEPETIAKLLRDERASTVAVVLSRLSESSRRAALDALTSETRDAATRRTTILERTTETAQNLEDALFNRALDDE